MLRIQRQFFLLMFQRKSVGHKHDEINNKLFMPTGIYSFLRSVTLPFASHSVNRFKV